MKPGLGTILITMFVCDAEKKTLADLSCRKLILHQDCYFVEEIHGSLLKHASISQIRLATIINHEIRYDQSLFHILFTDLLTYYMNILLTIY